MREAGDRVKESTRRHGVTLTALSEIRLFEEARYWSPNVMRMSSAAQRARSARPDGRKWMLERLVPRTPPPRGPGIAARPGISPPVGATRRYCASTHPSVPFFVDDVVTKLLG